MLLGLPQFFKYGAKVTPVRLVVFTKDNNIVDVYVANVTYVCALAIRRRSFEWQVQKLIFPVRGRKCCFRYV